MTLLDEARVLAGAELVWPGPPPALPAGVYDLPEGDYHADPQRGDGGSVSSTVCRHILPPDGCPRLVEHERQYPTWKPAFDLGSAVHRLVLGRGADLVEVLDDDGAELATWQKKTAQTQRKAAHAAGRVPLLTHELLQVEAAAAAVLADPVAGPLVEPGTFHPERAVIWRDDATGVWRRIMVDGYPGDDVRGRPIAFDVKTIGRQPSPRAITKAIGEHGYHQQQPFYEDGLVEMGIDDVGFLFIFVGIDPPHLVTVAAVDEQDVEHGRRLNRRAIDLWSRCQASGRWPGFSDGIELVTLPPWARKDDA